MRFPKWLTDMPFWGFISPIFMLSLAVALLGLTAIVIGIAQRNVGHMVAGSISIVPFLFLFFLLWRTYADDKWIKQ